jgi:hypothetical protein
MEDPQLQLISFIPRQHYSVRESGRSFGCVDADMAHTHILAQAPSCPRRTDEDLRAEVESKRRLWSALGLVEVPVEQAMPEKGRATGGI